MERLRNLDLNKNRTIGHRSNIDTSRPFRSVKEAVAIFGEQFPTMHRTTLPKPFSLPKKEAPIFSPFSPKLIENEPSWKHSLSSSPRNATLVDTVRKLEAELEQTKAELEVLKGKGLETEAALASLNAELHRTMSKLAWAEAEEEEMKIDHLLIGRTKSGPLPSLAQVMSVVGEKESLVINVGRGKGVKKKKKPIIPLFGDFFFSSRKKGSTNATDNPLYASSPLHWN